MTALVTSFTPYYERAKPYLESIKRHWTGAFIPLEIGKDVPDYGMPRSILQGGHFLSHLPDSVTKVIFTDADIILHRSLDDDELEFIEGLQDGEIAACPNKRIDQTWSEEVEMLWPTSAYSTYQGEWDVVRVFNTGFVVMTRFTYSGLFERFKALWPKFDKWFGHYAKIQLCMCSAAHDLGLHWKQVPYHLCTQGHFGSPNGVNPFVKPPTFNGRVIAFDHRVTN